MSPEQRAAKLYPEGTMDHAVQRERIARAIRRAENDALERAAKVIDRMYHADLSSACGPCIGAPEIRSLKTRAPRRKK